MCPHVFSSPPAGDASDQYKDLAKKLAYRADGCKLMMSRAFGIDVNKLLLLLYEIFSKQNLPAKAEQLVQEKQLGRVRTMSQSLKQRNNTARSGSDDVNNNTVGGTATMGASVNAGRSPDPKNMRSDSYNSAMDEHVKALEQLSRVSAIPGSNKTQLGSSMWIYL